MKRDAFTLPLEQTVAVLFARADSTYKTLPGTDVWDIERNARLWPGGAPVVAHPPCRAWGRLRQFAKPRKGERQLAIWSVRQVRRFGGVLEHPVGSLLWKKAGLPPPGQVDRYGGWTLPIHQNWWGHRAEKATLLYIVGCAPGDTPPFRSGWARRRTSFRAASELTAGRTSQRPSENTPHQSLRNGFASWPADARSAARLNGAGHCPNTWKPPAVASIRATLRESLCGNPRTWRCRLSAPSRTASLRDFYAALEARLLRSVLKLSRSHDLLRFPTARVLHERIIVFLHNQLTVSRGPHKRAFFGVTRHDQDPKRHAPAELSGSDNFQ